MFNHKIRVVLGLFILTLVFIGLTNLESFVYTGNVVSDFGKPPLAAAIFKLETDEVKTDVLYDLLDGGDANILLEPIDKNKEENSYLFLKWNKKISKLSIYMRKVGNYEEAYFEIWGPDNTKIASGQLDNEYHLYEFDLSKEYMSFEDYALFNFGPAEIKVDRVFGEELPESKSSRLIGILTEGFV
ncbi:hypothetical protein K8R33_04885 [archaeon]|nr:hypothetical protein [archaeon]